VVLCFGDSNTHGTMPMTQLTDRGRFGPDVRWPGVLAERLGPGWSVVEEGLPGRTTVHEDPIEGRHLDGLAAVPLLVATHTPIDAVVLALGTNDCKARFCVTPADIAESVAVLVAALRAAGVHRGERAPAIVVVAPAPLLEQGCLAGFFAGGAATSEAVRPLLRQRAADLGTGFVDAGAHIGVSAVDGVHLDADAHHTLGVVIAQELLSTTG
jgi:lysophospholipase L1-like esterase